MEYPDITFGSNQKQLIELDSYRNSNLYHNCIIFLFLFNEIRNQARLNVITSSIFPQFNQCILSIRVFCFQELYGKKDIEHKTSETCTSAT